MLEASKPSKSLYIKLEVGRTFGNTLQKTNMAMENPPFEDVFPIEN